MWSGPDRRTPEGDGLSGVRCRDLEGDVAERPGPLRGARLGPGRGSQADRGGWEYPLRLPHLRRRHLPERLRARGRPRPCGARTGPPHEDRRQGPPPLPRPPPTGRGAPPHAVRALAPQGRAAAARDRDVLPPRCGCPVAPPRGSTLARGRSDVPSVLGREDVLPPPRRDHRYLPQQRARGPARIRRFQRHPLSLTTAPTARLRRTRPPCRERVAEHLPLGGPADREEAAARGAPPGLKKSLYRFR